MIWSRVLLGRVHKHLPLDSISRVTRIQYTHSPPISSIFILILSSHLSLYLPTDLYISDFPIKILYAFLISNICATCLATCHLLWFEHPNIWCVQIIMLLIMQDSRFLCYSFVLGPNIIPSSLFPNTLYLCSFIRGRDKVSHPNKTKL
jgi:hypothetical protein